MRKQRNMPQMKQEKIPENKLNEMKGSNLPETEFKRMVIGCPVNLGGEWMNLMRTSTER